MPGRDARDLAILLREKARGDELVLAKLLPDPEIPDDIVGFHAQQAVEKLLKAAVALAGGVPPRTHDLKRLSDILADLGLRAPQAARDARRLAGAS